MGNVTNYQDLYLHIRDFIIITGLCTRDIIVLRGILLKM